MNLILKTLLWGSIIGVIHFVIVGLLYQNPFVAKLYKEAEGHPGVKKWDNQQRYLVSMFLGTQIEIFIMSIGYIFLISVLGKTFSSTLILALIFSGIRVYPRFWNMWIQSTYPNKLLVTEFINGIIGTFVIVFGLYLLPT